MGGERYCGGGHLKVFWLYYLIYTTTFDEMTVIFGFLTVADPLINFLIIY